jgi:hypothetical protein
MGDAEFGGQDARLRLSETMERATQAQQHLDATIAEVASHGVPLPPILRPEGGTEPPKQFGGSGVENPQPTRIISLDDLKAARGGSQTYGGVPLSDITAPGSGWKVDLSGYMPVTPGKPYADQDEEEPKPPAAPAEAESQEGSPLIDAAREQIDLMRSQAELAREILLALERQRDQARARESSAHRQWWVGTIITLVSLGVAVISLAIAFP